MFHQVVVHCSRGIAPYRKPRVLSTIASFLGWPATSGPRSSQYDAMDVEGGQRWLPFACEEASKEFGDSEQPPPQAGVALSLWSDELHGKELVQKLWHGLHARGPRPCCACATCKPWCQSAWASTAGCCTDGRQCQGCCDTFDWPADQVSQSLAGSCTPAQHLTSRPGGSGPTGGAHCPPHGRGEGDTACGGPPPQPPRSHSASRAGGSCRRRRSQMPRRETCGCQGHPPLRMHMHPWRKIDWR